jgi:hypothetical protein
MPGLGRSVTIPRVNGCVLLARGTRSRFSACGGAMLSLLRGAGEGSQPAWPPDQSDFSRALKKLRVISMVLNQI